VFYSALQCVIALCFAFCRSVLQRVAECCSVLQCALVCCSVLQCVAVCCSVLHCVAVFCSVLQCGFCCHVRIHEYVQHTQITPQNSATRCNTLQPMWLCMDLLLADTLHCNTLHHTATHRNTLQHTATRIWMCS